MPLLSFALILLAAALQTGCRTPASADAPEAASALWSGRHSRIDEASTQFVRDNDAWLALWQQIGREPPRAFDPVREVAVAIFLGQRRSGGYAIELVALRSEDEKRLIEYRETIPAPGMFVTQELTAPWTVIVLPSAGLPIEVRRLSAEKSIR